MIGTYLLNLVNKDIFVWLFTFLDFIWIKIFDIDQGIEKSSASNFLFSFL